MKAFSHNFKPSSPARRERTPFSHGRKSLTLAAVLPPKVSIPCPPKPPRRLFLRKAEGSGTLSGKSLFPVVRPRLHAAFPFRASS